MTHQTIICILVSKGVVLQLCLEFTMFDSGLHLLMHPTSEKRRFLSTG